MPPRSFPYLARNFGAQLRATRVALGITQERFAWECNVAKGFVSQIESGQRLPSMQVLFVFAARLGVKVGALLDFDPHTARQPAPSLAGTAGHTARGAPPGRAPRRKKR